MDTSHNRARFNNPTLVSLLIILVLTLISSPAARGQCGGLTPNIGDFRSAMGGTWTTLSTWETFDGSNWVPATGVPDASLTTELTTVCSPDDVSVPSNTVVTLGGSLLVESGATLSGQNAASTLQFEGGTLTNNGTISIDDFDIQGTAQSLSGTGAWTVNDFVITGSSATSLSSDVTLLVNTLTIDSGGTLSLAGFMLTIDGTASGRTFNNNGTISSPGTVVTQGSVTIQPDGTGNTGTFNPPLVVANSVTTVGGGPLESTLTVDALATLMVSSNAVLTVRSDVTVNGTLSGQNAASTLEFEGGTLTNNGTISIDDLDYKGTTQSLSGTGVWTVNDFVILSGSTTSLANDLTLLVNTLTIDSGGTLSLAGFTLTLDGTASARTCNNNGTITSPGTVVTQGSVTIQPDGTGNTGTFNPPLVVADSVTTVDGGPLESTVMVDALATLTVSSNAVLTARSDVTVNGTLSGQNAASTLQFEGGTLTNTGTISIDDLDMQGTTQTLAGIGAWTVNDFVILSGSTTSLANDLTPLVNTLTINSGGTLSLAGFTLTLDGTASARTFNNNGTITSPGTVVTQGSVTIQSDGTGNTGTFNPPLVVADGVTTMPGGPLESTVMVDALATLTVSSNAVLTARSDVTVNGTLSGQNAASTLQFEGGTLTNTGMISIDDLDVKGTVQTLSGTGVWTVNDFVIFSGSTTSLANDLTLLVNTLTTNNGGTLSLSGFTLTLDGTASARTFNNNGTISSPGTVVTQGSVTIQSDGTSNTGTFNPPLVVADGVTTMPGGPIVGAVTVALGATLSVSSNAILTAMSDVTIDGTLSGQNAASTFEFGGTAQTLSGSGDWPIDNIKILAGSTTTLGNDVTFSGNTARITNGGDLALGVDILTLSGTSLTVDAGGRLSGSGTLDFSAGVLDNNGTIAPGASPGILHLTGPYDHTGGAFEIELDNSMIPGTGHDQVAISGAPAAFNSGTINVLVTPGYVPSVGDNFTIVTCASGCTGTGLTVVDPPQFDVDVIYQANDIVLTVLSVSNQAPYVKAPIGDKSFALGDPPLDIDLNTVFDDFEGDPLTYGASTTDAAIAGASIVSGNTLRITPGTSGSAVVSVTATDVSGSGASAVDSLTVTLGGALPVELVSVDAIRDGDTILLTWATASETNNAGFEVQHKAVDESRPETEQTWEDLGFVNGAGTARRRHDYEYRAESLAPGLHRFRLRQLDFDGTSVISPEVEIRVEVTEPFVLSTAHPNPFGPRSTFTLAVRDPQPVRVVVYDMLGRRMALLHDGMMEPSRLYTFVLDGAGWASGTYLYRVTGSRFTITKSVILVR